MIQLTLLVSAESILVFMNDAFETNNPASIANALSAMARASNMTDVVQQTGLSHGQLYRSFSKKRKPILKTLFALFNILGTQLQAKSVSHSFSK